MRKSKLIKVLAATLIFVVLGLILTAAVVAAICSAV